MVLLRKAFITYASLIFCPKSFLMQQDSDIGSNNTTPKNVRNMYFISSHHCTCVLLPWDESSRELYIIVRVFYVPGMRAPVIFNGYNSSLCKSLYVCLLASLTVQISLFLFQFVHLYVHYYDLKKLCR